MYPDEITEELQTLAGEASDWFEQAERPDETKFTRLKDGAPEWVKELVREAHGDFFPDDYRYDKIENAVDWIHDAPDGTYTGDSASEFADSNVDVYTISRFHWLASHIQRQFYVNDALGDFGPCEDITDAVGWGQYRELEEIFYSVAGSLGEQLEERDD